MGITFESLIKMLQQFKIHFLVKKKCTRVFIFKASEVGSGSGCADWLQISLGCGGSGFVNFGF